MKQSTRLHYLFLEKSVGLLVFEGSGSVDDSQLNLHALPSRPATALWLLEKIEPFVESQLLTYRCYARLATSPISWRRSLFHDIIQSRDWRSTGETQAL